MHDECIRHDALLRVFERLGRKEPQLFDEVERVPKREEQEVKKDADGDDGMVSPPATDSEKKEATDEKPSLNDIKLPMYKGAQPRPEKSITKKGPRKEPYRGLFDASIRLDNGPTTWEVKDLRGNVESGVKTWLEKAHCLFCDQTID